MCVCVWFMRIRRDWMSQFIPWKYTYTNAPKHACFIRNLVHTRTRAVHVVQIYTSTSNAKHASLDSIAPALFYRALLEVNWAELRWAETCSTYRIYFSADEYSLQLIASLCTRLFRSHHVHWTCSIRSEWCSLTQIYRHHKHHYTEKAHTHAEHPD